MRQDSVQPDQPAIAVQQPRRARRLRRLVLGLGTLAIISVIGGTALSLWRMHADVIQHSEDHLRSLAQILGVQAQRSTHAIDTLLSATAEDAQRSEKQGRITASEALHQHYRESIASTPYVRALALMDASGKLVINTRQFPALPLDFSRFDLFRAHQESRNVQLVVSAPVTEPTPESLAPLSLDGLIRDERGIRYAPEASD